MKSHKEMIKVFFLGVYYTDTIPPVAVTPNHSFAVSKQRYGSKPAFKGRPKPGPPGSDIYSFF